MLKLHLTRADNYEGVYLQLPATPAEIGEAWAGLDNISDEISSTRIVGAISEVGNIGRYLKSADVNDPEQMKKLNCIAEIVNTLDSDKCHLLEGALDTESINGLDDVSAIGERLNLYLLIPHVTNDRELGICLVITGVKPFDMSVRPYLDYDRIGVEYYSEHGGAYTAGGYVVRRDSVEQELRDFFDNQDRHEFGSMQMG